MNQEILTCPCLEWSQNESDKLTHHPLSTCSQESQHYVPPGGHAHSCSHVTLHAAVQQSKDGQNVYN